MKPRGAAAAAAASAGLPRHLALLGPLLALAGLEVGGALPTFLALRERNSTFGTSVGAASESPYIDPEPGLPPPPKSYSGPASDTQPFHQTDETAIKDQTAPDPKATDKELINRASPDFGLAHRRRTTSTATTTTIKVYEDEVTSTLPGARRRRTEGRRRRTMKATPEPDYAWGGLTTTPPPEIHPTPPIPVWQYTDQFTKAAVVTSDAAMASQQALGAAMGYTTALGSPGEAAIAGLKANVAAVAAAKAASAAATSATTASGHAAKAWAASVAAEQVLGAHGQELDTVANGPGGYATAKWYAQNAFVPGVPTKPPLVTSTMAPGTTPSLLPAGPVTTAPPYTQLA